MPRYDPERIQRLISSLREAVRHLKRLKTLDEKEFLKDIDKIASTKYHFVIAIESAIDICNHIIAQNGFRAPKDYADTFVVLGERGVFEEDFLKDLKNMARFRNRLIHLYWEVDNKQVYKILQTCLDDFGRFLQAIADYLKLEKD
ncbi:MAG: DUF86 domain-containing protein [Deltaproteobacteria bacterium]|nr:DUF86 domain-containing protein [Deltaproteobacteria bacterium]